MSLLYTETFLIRFLLVLFFIKLFFTFHNIMGEITFLAWIQRWKQPPLGKLDRGGSIFKIDHFSNFRKKTLFSLRRLMWDFLPILIKVNFIQLTKNINLESVLLINFLLVFSCSIVMLLLCCVIVYKFAPSTGTKLYFV